MSATVAKLEAVLEAKTHAFDHAMDKSHSKMAKVGKVALGAGLAIAGGLVVGMEKSVHAAIDAQASQERLNQSFKNVHLSMRTYKDSLDAAESSSRKLGFTDTQVRDALGSLLPATKNVELATKDLAVAQDLARFKHIQLQDATKMLTMAMTGSQRAAKQLGITVSPVTKNVDALSKSATSAEKAHAKLLDKMATGNAVIARTSALVHGQADAYSQTAAGGMEQFHAQIEHLQATMGEKLLPVLTRVLEKVTAFISYLSAHPHVAKAFAIGLAAVAAGFIAVAVASGIATLAASPWIAAAIGIVAGLAAIGAGLVYAWRHSETFRNAVGALWAIFKLTPLGLIITHLGAVSAAFSAVTGAIGSVISALRDAVNWVQRLVDTISRIHLPHLPGDSGNWGAAMKAAKKGKGATGGIVTRPTWSLIGEAGPEAVIPLNRMPGASPLPGGGNTIFNFPNYVGSRKELIDCLRQAEAIFRNQNGRPAFGGGT